MTGVASSQTFSDPVPVTHFPFSTSHFHFIFRFAISVALFSLPKSPTFKSHGYLLN